MQPTITHQNPFLRSRTIPSSLLMSRQRPIRHPSAVPADLPGEITD
jgi:hypothetical protein